MCLVLRCTPGARNTSTHDLRFSLNGKINFRASENLYGCVCADITYLITITTIHVCERECERQRFYFFFDVSSSYFFSHFLNLRGSEKKNIGKIWVSEKSAGKKVFNARPAKVYKYVKLGYLCISGVKLRKIHATISMSKCERDGENEFDIVGFSYEWEFFGIFIYYVWKNVCMRKHDEKAKCEEMSTGTHILFLLFAKYYMGRDIIII